MEEEVQEVETEEEVLEVVTKEEEEADQEKEA